jgi:hypothetical protein
MSEEKDPYYSRPEVSNSDLTELEKYWMPESLVYDIQVAYKFGTLLDCLITEPEKVNYYKFTCAGQQYTREDFELAAAMKRAFWKDPLCAVIAKHSEYQKICIRQDFKIEYEGYEFNLPVRCKFDLNAKATLGITADIKSTSATTEKQFIDACHHFRYLRQRSLYVDIDDVKKDMIIGISKVNQKVFKIPFVRGGELYKIGKAQYQELAFKYAYLFGDVSKIRKIENYSIAI